MAAVVNPSNQGISPPPPGVTPNFVDPPDHQLGVVPILIVFNSLATIALALRLYTKIRILKLVGWEDAAITVAWGCNITVMIMYFIGIPLHNETHIWDLSIQNFMKYIKPALAVDLLLSPSAGLPKIAILLFYLRINPSRKFQICTKIIIALTWAFIISIFCAIFFSCHPIKRLWDPTVEGWCIPSLSIILSVPIISTGLDLMIIALPIPMLVKLRANLRTKIVVAAIFSAFSCTTIITAIRIGFTARLFGDVDITWDASLSGDLTLVEANMMIVCSSVLVLRPFCRRYFPSLLGRDSKPSVGLPGEKASDGQLNYDGPSGPNSKSEYRTKVQGGKSKGSSRSRNLWSLSFANTTKVDDEDLESLDTEMKRLQPTAADMDGHGSKEIMDDKEGHSAPHTTSGDSTPFHGAGAVGQATSNAPPYPQVPTRTWNRGPNADVENGIVKTVSLDVRGRAY